LLGFNTTICISIVTGTGAVALNKVFLFTFSVLFLTSQPSFADMNAANKALARGDHAAAAVEFQKLAEQGDKKAQANLGYMYYVGEGVEQDYTKAVKWYKKAAILGDKDSQYNLAVAYAFGEGVKQSYKEAFHWYRRAAEQNHPVAQYSLGVSYAYGEGIAQNPELAAEWFKKSAEQGYERAQVQLGSLYHTGDGVEKNYEQAAVWYRKAADKGDAAAQYNLGTMYRSGNGVAKDYNQAVRWFRLSADQGYAAAQNELASMERAIAGANRPTPVSVPEVEDVPAQDETVQTESVKEPSQIPTIAKSEPEPKPVPEPEIAAVEEPTRPETIESPAPDSTESTTEVGEKPKWGFFSKLFGKKDAVDPEPEQSGAVYETPGEGAAPENKYMPTLGSRTVVVEKNVTTEPEIIGVVFKIDEAPNEGFFNRLFAKKDTAVSATEELTEPSIEESSEVLTYAADSAPEGQQLESSTGVEITVAQLDPVETPTQLPADSTLTEPELVVEDKTEITIEAIPERETKKKGFFSRLFDGKKSDDAGENSATEEITSEEVVEIDTLEEPIVIAKLEEPELDAPIEESEEIIIESIDVTPDAINTGAASDIRPLAVKGDSTAQLQLATLYYQGKGVKQDYSQAFLWYRRAAQQGDADAQYSLGNMYLMGEGIKQDDYQARQWYEKAAEQGHEGAQHNLQNLQRIAAAEPEPEYNPIDNNPGNELPEQDDGTFGEPEKKKGFFSKLFGKNDVDEKELDAADGSGEEIDELETSSEQISADSSEATGASSASAIYEKGLAFEFGEGVPQDYRTAFEFFKKSADQNYAPAQYKLGLAYAYGQGTEINPEVAVEWYKKSAAQGYALAQRTLATLYMSGDGIEQNKPLALAWYDILADSGNVMDVRRRDALKEKLTSDEIDEANILKQGLSN
jgi:TPR repeat protein